jgi:hypothetical protein
VLPTPFLDLSGSVDTKGERGLLGMTFDPEFAANRRFYVNYIDKVTLNTVVATYEASAAQPNLADATSGQTVITIEQPPASTTTKLAGLASVQARPEISTSVPATVDLPMTPRTAHRTSTTISENAARRCIS